MTREPVVAEREPFDPSRISATRVNKLTECGVAFRRYYIEGEPPPRKGSFALNGSVVHTALETWATDRSEPLFGLMQDAWITETEESPVVWEFLTEYRKISSDVIRAEAAARADFEKRNPGKESKAPRMTKTFKESKAAKDLWRLLKTWEPRLSAESPWEFTERDPLPQFYDDSLVLAKRYEKQYAHLNPALYVELKVEEPWRGFTIIGYVDEVELLLHPETGEVQGVGIIDYKTYRREPAEHKDYRQLVLYDIAFRSLVDRGAIALPVSLDDVPLYVGIDYVKYAGVDVPWLRPAGNSRRWWKIDAEDHDRVERELIAYRNTVEAGAYLPAAKSVNPDYCDYGETCCLRSTAKAGGCAAPVEVAL